MIHNRAATRLTTEIQSEVNMVFMAVHSSVLSLIAGIMILIWPRLLNYIVAIYLIVIGLIGIIR
jgi:hypothetical protein